MVTLSADGRCDVSELAKKLGVNPATARRILDRLIETDTIRFRTDLAAHYTEWPVLVNYWASVPAKRVNDIGRILSSLPETRLCVALAGPHNLLFTVWLRTLADSLRLEVQLADKLPELVVADRAVTLVTFKRMGRLLDSRGRAIGVVPMDIWTDTTKRDLEDR